MTVIEMVSSLLSFNRLVIVMVFSPAIKFIWAEKVPSGLVSRIRSSDSEIKAIVEFGVAFP